MEYKENPATIPRMAQRRSKTQLCQKASPIKDSRHQRRRERSAQKTIRTIHHSKTQLRAIIAMFRGTRADPEDRRKISKGPLLSSPLQYAGSFRPTKTCNFPQFLTFDAISCKRGDFRPTQVATFLQFLTFNVYFVRKGCRGKHQSCNYSSVFDA
jgi:hypothetical protein